MGRMEFGRTANGRPYRGEDGFFDAPCGLAQNDRGETKRTDCHGPKGPRNDRGVTGRTDSSTRPAGLLRMTEGTWWRWNFREERQMEEKT